MELGGRGRGVFYNSGSQSGVILHPQGIFDSVWKHVGLSQQGALGAAAQLASRASRPGTLLNIPQCTGHLPQQTVIRPPVQC